MSNKHNYVSLSLLTITAFLVVFFTRALFAVEAVTCADGSNTCGEATVYKVTMTKLELCTGAPLTSETDITCTGAVTVGSTTKTFDIASVNGGLEVGEWISTAGLPIGTTFTHAKPTFSKEFTLKGAVKVNSNLTCYTDENSTIGSNTKYETIMAGKTTSPATEQVMHMFTDGSVKVCQTDNSDNTCANTGNSTWTKNVPDDTANYGSALGDTGSSVDTTSMIYALTTAYTVGPVAPKITINFGTKSGLEAGRDSNDDNGCYINIYYPKVNITITD